jgi:hypothetical protein
MITKAVITPTAAPTSDAVRGLTTPNSPVKNPIVNPSAPPAITEPIHRVRSVVISRDSPSP